MDIEFNNQDSDISNLLCKLYLEKMGEDYSMSLPLINFYKVYRAYVRGKVISFTLNDPNISNEEKNKAKKTALEYFELAHSYIKDTK
jgi:aminoglycoside phosphotransferase family enzyme